MVEKKYKVDPKKRFSSRVENYIKYRPSYPLEIIDFLKMKKILSKDTVIADIGSGTGILTKIFLDNGNQVCLYFNEIIIPEIMTVMIIH